NRPKPARPLLDWLEGLEQDALQGLIAGHNLAIPDRTGLAGEVGDDAAGFLDQQEPRSDVPRLEAGFPDGVKPAGSEPGHVEADRSGAADAGDRRIDCGKLAELQGVV